MAGPWEKFSNQSAEVPTSAPATAGPWEKFQPDKPDSSNKKGAFVESAGEMLTYGYGANIKASIAETLSKAGVSRAKTLAVLDSPLNDLISGKAFKDLPELKNYAEALDFAKGSQKELFDENPGSALAGTVGGAFLPGKIVFKGAKKLGTGAKLLRTAATGGANAALFNPGDVEGEGNPLQLRERAKNLGAGAGLATLLGGAGIAAQKAAPKVKDSASRLASRALGRGNKGLKEKIGDKGLKEMGRTALDEGVVGYVPRGIRKLNDRVKGVLDKSGKKIGEVIDEIDGVEKTFRAQGYTVGVPKQAIVNKIKSEILDPELFPDPDFVKKVGRRLNVFTNTGKGSHLPTKGVQTIKTRLGQAMDEKGVWKRAKMGMLNEDDMFKLAMYDALNEAVNDAAVASSKLANKPKLVAKINEAKKLYSTAKNMAKITKDEISRTNTNNLFMQMSPLIVGGAALAGGQDIGTSTALGAGALALKRGGPQVGSRSLDSMSRLLENIGRIPATGKAAGLLTGKRQKDKNEESAFERKLRGN